MTTETQTKHGDCPTHGTVEATREIPRITFPPITAVAGTGVARRRLSTPDSRCAVTEMTRFTNEAAMMPRAMIPGT